MRSRAPALKVLVCPSGFPLATSGSWHRDIGPRVELWREEGSQRVTAVVPLYPCGEAMVGMHV